MALGSTMIRRSFCEANNQEVNKAVCEDVMEKREMK
jgi:hypothetical protein